MPMIVWHIAIQSLAREGRITMSYKAVCKNRVIRIEESKTEEYSEMGYTVYDLEDNLIAEAEINTLEEARAVIKGLREENEALKAVTEGLREENEAPKVAAKKTK